MRARTLLLTLFLAATFAPLRPARAQSLADVARKEAERRKEVKEPTKTFTNQDLPNAPAPASASPTSGSTDTAAAAAADGDSAKPAGDTPAKDGDVQKDEKYWGGKIKALRDAAAQNQVLLDAMQARINGLTTDFVNRDDPAQRSVIAQDRQKAIDQLAKLKDAAVADAKAITDFEEEARRAGVPPGWLR